MGYCCTIQQNSTCLLTVSAKKSLLIYFCNKDWQSALIVIQNVTPKFPCFQWYLTGLELFILWFQWWFKLSITHYLIEKWRPCNFIPLFYCEEGGKVYLVCNLEKNHLHWLLFSHKENMISIIQSKQNPYANA